MSDVEPACPIKPGGNYRPASPSDADTTARPLCSLCFPDGEIPEGVGEVCYSWRGNHVHQTLRDAGEPIDENAGGGVEGTKLSTKLADPEISEIADLREVDL